MPGQFFSPEGDLEEHFITNHWLIDQYIGDQLWGWGLNDVGQLGTNDTITRSTPVREWTSSTNWKQIATSTCFAFSRSSAAIKTDGTLWTWGYNFFGQLATNNNVNRLTPVREWTSSTNWSFVSMSAENCAAIKTDGTLWSWGRNYAGQLATNDNVNRLTPVQEWTSSTNWKYVNIGNNVTAAIKTDGTLWTWGLNTFGQLGTNDTIIRSTPVQEATSSTNWKQCVPASGLNSFGMMAIKTNGTLWAWGNGAGSPSRSTPIQEFTSSTSWKQIVGQFLLQKNDGVIYRIGANHWFSLALLLEQEATGTYSNNWKYFSGGYDQGQFSGVKSDGTLWSYGWNVNGSMGNNTRGGYQTTPVQEFNLNTNWKQVSAFGYVSSTDGHTLALKTGIEMDTGNLTS